MSKHPTGYDESSRLCTLCLCSLNHKTKFDLFFINLNLNKGKICIEVNKPKTKSSFMFEKQKLKNV